MRRREKKLLVVMILLRTARLGPVWHDTERHATSSRFALERKIKAKAWINRLDARSASKAFAFLLFSLSFLFLLFFNYIRNHAWEREWERKLHTPYKMLCNVVPYMSDLHVCYYYWAYIMHDGHVDMRANLYYELYAQQTGQKFTCKKGELLLEL